MTQEELITKSIKWVATHTPYSVYQCFRVISIANKWDSKAIYHMSRKQQECFSFLTTAINMYNYGEQIDEQ